MSTAPSNHSTNIMPKFGVFWIFSSSLPLCQRKYMDSRRFRFMLTISKECSEHHRLCCLGVMLYLKLFSELHVSRWQNGLRWVSHDGGWCLWCRIGVVWILPSGTWVVPRHISIWDSSVRNAGAVSTCILYSWILYPWEECLGWFCLKEIPWLHRMLGTPTRTACR